MSTAELELQLRALAAELDFPAPPDLAPAVRGALERPRRVCRRRWLVAALAVLVVALAGVLAVPSARTAVEEWLGIGGVRFEFVSRLPERRVVGTPDLGTSMSLRDAEDSTPFRIVVPPGGLGRYTLYVHEPPRAGVVSFVYGTKRRARMILSELPGDYRPYISKTISQTTVVTETEVNGRPALWLEGAHFVEFADRAGHFGFEPARLAGRVLLWERGGVTYRLEGDLSRDQALKVAEAVG